MIDQSIILLSITFATLANLQQFFLAINVNLIHIFQYTRPYSLHLVFSLFSYISFHFKREFEI